MNDTLQQALADILNGAAESAARARDFVLAEMPDVVQQLLLWKAAESIVYCVTGVALLVICVLLARRGLRLYRSDSEAAAKAYQDGESWTRYTAGSQVTSMEYDFYTATGGPRAVFSLMGAAVLFFVGAAFVNLAWLQIWLAPKVYLIEYAAELVK